MVLREGQQRKMEEDVDVLPYHIPYCRVYVRFLVGEHVKSAFSSLPERVACHVRFRVKMCAVLISFGEYVGYEMGKKKKADGEFCSSLDETTKGARRFCDLLKRRKKKAGFWSPLNKTTKEAQRVL